MPASVRILRAVLCGTAFALVACASTTMKLMVPAGWRATRLSDEKAEFVHGCGSSPTGAAACPTVYVEHFALPENSSTSMQSAVEKSAADYVALVTAMHHQNIAIDGVSEAGAAVKVVRSKVDGRPCEAAIMGIDRQVVVAIYVADSADFDAGLKGRDEIVRQFLK